MTESLKAQPAGGESCIAELGRELAQERDDGFIAEQRVKERGGDGHNPDTTSEPPGEQESHVEPVPVAAPSNGPDLVREREALIARLEQMAAEAEPETPPFQLAPETKPYRPHVGRYGSDPS